MQVTGKQVEFSRIYISPALAIRIPFAAPSVLPLLTYTIAHNQILITYERADLHRHAP